MSKTQVRWISFSGRALATVALMTTGGFLLHAQTAGSSGTPLVQGVSAPEPIFNLQTATNGASDASGDAYSSSLSSSGLNEPDAAGTEVALNTKAPFHFSMRCNMAAVASAMGGRSTGAGIRTLTARRSTTSLWAAGSGCRSATSSTTRRRAGRLAVAAGGCSTHTQV